MKQKIQSIIMLPISVILLGLSLRGAFELFYFGWSVFGWL